MKIRALILSLTLFAGITTLHSQFVDIRIELTSYNEMKLVGENSADIKNGTLLQWLKISVQENIVLGVRLKYHEIDRNEKKLDMKVLNDNTSDLSKAVSVNGTYANMPVCSCNKPFDEKSNVYRKFTTWIGFPSRQITELVIDYN